MKYIKVLFFSILLIFPAISFAAPSDVARVAKADADFAQALKNTPDKEVSAVAFFNNDMSPQDVRMAFYNTPLVVKGFRHGTQFYSGGYSLKSGETLDEAIVNYNRDHLFFLQKRMETEDKMLATETNAELRNAMVAHRKEADQMKADFEKNGIRVVGVEVVGRLRDMQDFKGRTPFVRVIELKETGKKQPAIVPNP